MRDARAAAQLDVVGRDALDPSGHAEVDAEGLEVAPYPRAQRRRVGREELRPGLDEHDVQRLGGEAAVVARDDVSSELGEGTRHLDSRRTAADDHEGEEGRAGRGILEHDGPFEGPQHVVPERPRVLEVVEPEGGVARAGDAEVLRRSSRGHDEVGVGDAVAGRRW